MNHVKRSIESGPKEIARMEAFSDGVFAIAITLLVLDLITILHPLNGESLLRSFLHHWEPFLAFLIGFLTILVCWINHNHVFHFIKKSDSNLPWVNGFVLLMISFTPFPTAILAEYIGTEGRLALAIFGFNYLMIAIASYWICAYPYKRSLIDEEDREYFQCIKLAFGYSIIYILITFLISFISTIAAIIMYSVMFYVFAFPKKFALRLLKRKNKRSSKSAKQ